MCTEASLNDICWKENIVGYDFLYQPWKTEQKKKSPSYLDKRDHTSRFFFHSVFFLSSPRFLRNRCSNDWMRIDEKEKHPFRIIIDQSAVIARQRLCIFLFCNYQMYINNTHKNFFFDVVFYMKKHRDIQISKKKGKLKGSYQADMIWREKKYDRIHCPGCHRRSMTCLFFINIRSIE